MSRRIYFLKVIAVFLSIVFSSKLLASEVSLLEIYNLALKNDLILQKAASDYEAAKQNLPIAVSQLLPNISANAAYLETYQEDAAIKHGNSKKYSLSLSQPLFSLPKWFSLQQANENVRESYASYVYRQQDLLSRVANAYFDIQKAVDNLELSESEYQAFSRHLEQTKQKFAVGIIGINDVHDARVRRDSASADIIIAKNNLDNEYEQLFELIGFRVDKVLPISKAVKATLLAPNNNIDAWLDLAFINNFQLKASRARFEQAVSAKRIA